MQEISYRGYKIIADSFVQEDGKWTPKATIEPLDESPLRDEGPLVWTEKFDSQEEADSFALQSAEFHIDMFY
jgi:hypothetical protein